MFKITSLKQIIFFMAHTNFWIEWFIESRIEARQLLEVLMTWLQISKALIRVPFANRIASVLGSLYLISPLSYYWRPIKFTTLSYFNYIQVTWLIWFKSELISRLKLYCRHKKIQKCKSTTSLLVVCPHHNIFWRWFLPSFKIIGISHRKYSTSNSHSMYGFQFNVVIGENLMSKSK